MKMEIKHLIEGLNYTLLSGNLEKDIVGIEYDSKKVAKDSIFVAIKGYETDGHQYISQGISAGASVVVLDNEEYARAVEGVSFLLVDNSRKALAELSSTFFGKPATQLTLIGVTGTNGKTSVTYLLKSILKEAGYKVGIIGTIENQIDEEVVPSDVTTPESRDLQELLSRMVEKGCHFCLMETSSHALYLDRVWSIPFTGAIFTNLTQDHLDFHKSLEEYLEAKMLLFRRLGTNSFAVINQDDPASEKIIPVCPGKIVTYGLKEKADLFPQDITSTIAGTSFRLEIDGELRTISLGMLGEFSIYNSLAAIGAAIELGVSRDLIIKGIAKVHVNGRFQVVKSNRDFAVVVDYAHTPDGLYTVLKTARKITEGRVICVFGCGGDRDKTKRPIMGRVAGELCDTIIITSDNPRTEDPDSILDMIEVGVREVTENYMKIQNRRKAIEEAISQGKAGDLVIIAGKGHEDYQIIGKTKHHFSDIEIAREFLQDGVK